MKQPINKEWKRRILEIIGSYTFQGDAQDAVIDLFTDFISTLLKQQKQEIKEKFIELAIDGDIDDEMKGLLLYIRFLEYLKYEK